jgi:hypothetical protein
MPSWAKAAIDVWTGSAGIASGHLFRPVNKGGRLAGERMTAQAVFNTVKLYAAAIGVENFAPHDLRRSYAKLAHKGHAPLEQIQISLGHASIQTTERYLGVEQDFTDAPCDHLGLRIFQHQAVDVQRVVVVVCLYFARYDSSAEATQTEHINRFGRYTLKRDRIPEPLDRVRVLRIAAEVGRAGTGKD